jgi:hypothetical protein
MFRLLVRVCLSSSLFRTVKYGSISISVFNMSSNNSQVPASTGSTGTTAAVTQLIQNTGAFKSVPRGISAIGQGHDAGLFAREWTVVTYYNTLDWTEGGAFATAGSRNIHGAVVPSTTGIVAGITQRYSDAKFLKLELKFIPMRGAAGHIFDIAVGVSQGRETAPADRTAIELLEGNTYVDLVPLMSVSGFPAPATWDVNMDLPFITDVFKPANFYQQPPRLNYNARLHFPAALTTVQPLLAVRVRVVGVAH